jgi:hypothetical protein
MSFPPPPSPLRSAPEQKALSPEPVMQTALTSSSLSAISRYFMSKATASPPMELRFRSRLMTMYATLSLTS